MVALVQHRGCASGCAAAPAAAVVAVGHRVDRRCVRGAAIRCVSSPSTKCLQRQAFAADAAAAAARGRATRCSISRRQQAQRQRHPAAVEQLGAANNASNGSMATNKDQPRAEAAAAAAGRRTTSGASKGGEVSMVSVTAMPWAPATPNETAEGQRRHHHAGQQRGVDRRRKDLARPSRAEVKRNRHARRGSPAGWPGASSNTRRRITAQAATRRAWSAMRRCRAVNSAATSVRRPAVPPAAASARTGPLSQLAAGL